MGEPCEFKAPEIDPENNDAWELWNAVATQWRAGVMGAPAGLDYNALFAVAQALGIIVTPGVLIKIRALENEVLTARAAAKTKGGQP